MDNLSEEINEKEEDATEGIEEKNSEPETKEEKVQTPQPANPSTEDIQFEESIDIDAIQRQLQESIEKGDLPTESEDNKIKEPLFEIKKDEQRQLVSKSQTEVGSKKYVIYINRDNIDFMENLSVDERKDLINKVLKEQNEISVQRKAIAEKRNLIIHVSIAVITFIIFMPLLFLGVKKASEVTITNYHQTKKNITKLYKEQGKIKMRGSEIP